MADVSASKEAVELNQLSKRMLRDIRLVKKNVKQNRKEGRET